MILALPWVWIGVARGSPSGPSSSGSRKIFTSVLSFQPVRLNLASVSATGRGSSMVGASVSTSSPGSRWKLVVRTLISNGAVRRTRSIQACGSSQSNVGKSWMPKFTL